MHHIHISTEFLSAVLLFVFGIVTLVLLSSGAKRRERQKHDEMMARERGGGLHCFSY